MAASFDGGPGGPSGWAPRSVDPATALRFAGTPPATRRGRGSASVEERLVSELRCTLGPPAVSFSAQSLCLTHTGKPTGVAVSHCITWFQMQLILTTCQIRYHSQCGIIVAPDSSEP